LLLLAKQIRATNVRCLCDDEQAVAPPPRQTRGPSWIHC
jgi:hypothetical protein